MKSPSIILLIAKIIAILIVVAYAIGLFQSYDALKASVLLVVAVVIGMDIVFWANQTTTRKQ